MKRFIQSNWPYLILLAALAAIFAPCFGKYMCFPAPDYSAYGFPARIAKLNELLSGKTGAALQDMVELMLPPYVFCNIVYPVEAFLTALAFGWFLRGRGADRASAAFGGLVFALAGYSMTLFSAGHRGFFAMTLYAVLAFSFLSRAIDGERPLGWALAACSFVWMLHYQIDFAAVFIILSAIYALCLIVRRWRVEADKKRYARRLALGILSAAAAFAIVGAPVIHNAFAKTLGERISQIERESPAEEARPAQPAEAGGEAAGAGDDSKWIFTTNWSLPPDETLEFVAPAVMGRQSGDPELPYWGRLGRSWKWEETRRGFMNFRQHIVYVGAIPLAMALLALLVFLRRPGAGGETPDLRHAPPDLRFEVRFWAVAWVVGLLLAFGRHTPFYRLFYAIPYLSYLRAPVKFVRIIELSTAVLAALGATALVAGTPPRRALRRLAAVSAALAALLALFAAATSAAQPAFLAPLARLGADASLMAAMKANAIRALGHGIAGFAIVAAVAFLRSGARPIPGCAALAALSVAAAVDFAIVERPFAFVRDMEYKYTDRNVVTTVAAEAMRPGAPVVGMFIRDQALKTALADNMGFHAGNVHPRNGLDHSQFIRNGGPDAVFRLTDVTGCGFILIDADQAAQLPRDRFTPVAGLARRSPPLLVERTATPGRDGLILAKVNNPRPYAQLFPKWSASTEETLLADTALQMPGQGMDESLPVIGGPAPSGGQYSGAAVPVPVVVSVQGIGGARRTVVETDAPCDAMLLVHRGHNKRNCAFLDGGKVPQYKAGYSETAVFVPAGRHRVEVVNAAGSPALAAVSLLVVLAFAAGLVREAAAG